MIQPRQGNKTTTAPTITHLGGTKNDITKNVQSIQYNRWDREYQSRDGQQENYVRKSNVEEMWRCFCDRQYSSYSAVYMHIRNKHEGQGLHRITKPHKTKGRPKRQCTNGKLLCIFRKLGPEQKEYLNLEVGQYKKEINQQKKGRDKKEEKGRQMPIDFNLEELEGDRALNSFRNEHLSGGRLLHWFAWKLYKMVRMDSVVFGFWGFNLEGFPLMANYLGCSIGYNGMGRVFMDVLQVFLQWLQIKQLTHISVYPQPIRQE